MCNPCLTRHQESTARPAPQMVANDFGPRINPLSSRPLLSCTNTCSLQAIPLDYGPLGPFTRPLVAFAVCSSLILKRSRCAGFEQSSQVVPRGPPPEGLNRSIGPPTWELHHHWLGILSFPNTNPSSISSEDLSTRNPRHAVISVSSRSLDISSTHAGEAACAALFHCILAHVQVRHLLRHCSTFPCGEFDRP